MPTKGKKKEYPNQNHTNYRMKAMKEINSKNTLVVDKARLVELHKNSFNDGDFYAKFFFENRFSDKWAWFTECDGKIVSAVYARPFTLKVMDKVFDVPFFTGIATDKAYRNLGLARRTIEKAIKALELEGAPFVILHPFLHEFYRNLNFETVSFVNTKRVVYDERVKTEYRDLTIDDIALATELYSKKLSVQNAYRVRSEDEVKLILSEHLGDQGRAFVILNCDIPVGYVLADNEGIREAIVPDYTMLNGIKELDGNSYFDHENGIEEHTMARVVNLEKLLSLVPYRAKITGEYLFDVNGKSYLLKVENGSFVSLTESRISGQKIGLKELIQTALGQKKHENLLTNVFPEYNLVIYEKY